MRYVDVQSRVVPYTVEGKYTYHYIATGPLNMDKLNLTIRRDTRNLSPRNDVLAETINNPYSFDLFIGWWKDPN